MRRLATAGGLGVLLLLLGCAASGVARDQRPRHQVREHRHLVRQPSARQGHKVQHVVWILMENKDYSSVVGPGSAPYINRLARRYGVATNYSAISHPSLPNYIALTSGSDQGISDDSDPSSHRLNVPSIFSQLPGSASRSLEQAMPSTCAKGDSGEYAVRHNPETYYTNLGQECSRYDVPFGAKPDLSARFTFVTPNLINDMHDGSISDGDRFLQSYVPALMATAQYRSRNTVIFITWDENDGASGNRVPCIVISPFTHGVRDGTGYTHYSLLRTTEALLGLPLLSNARSANSMLGKFGF
jgi:phosphatidylinositol-3-phosphatase